MELHDFRLKYIPKRTKLKIKYIKENEKQTKYHEKIKENIFKTPENML